MIEAGRSAGRAGAAAVKGFWSGFTYPFRGARLVYFKSPGLVRYWIWPILITMICFAGVFAAALVWNDDLLELFWTVPSGDGFWIGLQKVLRPVVQGILFLALIVAGFFAIYLVTSIFAAPFNDMLSEEVERISRGKEPPPFSLARLGRDLLMTARLELTKALLYAVVMLPSFFLSLLLPIVGEVLYAVFGYFFTIVFFAVDYTDWPLARRGRGVRRRLGLLRRNFVRMAGLGTAVWLFVLIPIVGLFFMPAAVAGGTLLVLDMEDEGALD